MNKVPNLTVNLTVFSLMISVFCILLKQSWLTLRLGKCSFMCFWIALLLSDLDLQSMCNSFINFCTLILYISFGLLRWLSGKESACQCRRLGFDPWVGTIPWRRKWLPTLVFLPGKFHGPRSLADYSPFGCKELNAPEQLSNLIPGSSISKILNLKIQPTADHVLLYYLLKKSVSE